MAASTALPPSRRTSRPTAEARVRGEQTAWQEKRAAVIAPTRSTPSGHSIAASGANTFGTRDFLLGIYPRRGDYSSPLNSSCYIRLSAPSRATRFRAYEGTSPSSSGSVASGPSEKEPGHALAVDDPRDASDARDRTRWPARRGPGGPGHAQLPRNGAGGPTAHGRDDHRRRNDAARGLF